MHGQATWRECMLLPVMQAGAGKLCTGSRTQLQRRSHEGLCPVSQPCWNLLFVQLCSSCTCIGLLPCVNTAQHCAAETCPEGQLWYTNCAFPRGEAASVSRGTAEPVEWPTNTVRQGKALWKLWLKFTASPVLSPQDNSDKLLCFLKGSWPCGHHGSSDHLSPWWLAHPRERPLRSALAHQSQGQSWPGSVLNHTSEEVSVSESTLLKRRLLQNETQHTAPHPPCTCQLSPDPSLPSSCFSSLQIWGTAHYRVCPKKRQRWHCATFRCNRGLASCVPCPVPSFSLCHTQGLQHIPFGTFCKNSSLVGYDTALSLLQTLWTMKMYRNP